MKKCVLYLRMNPELFQADNWRRFVAFVKKMKMITVMIFFFLEMNFTSFCSC
ncbi:putative beta-amylase [Helianthus annuus]|nr:putative beta-amylase [Helianthus annuus]